MAFKSEYTDVVFVILRLHPRNHNVKKGNHPSNPSNRCKCVRFHYVEYLGRLGTWLARVQCEENSILEGAWQLSMRRPGQTYTSYPRAGSTWDERYEPGEALKVQWLIIYLVTVGIKPGTLGTQILV